MSYVREYEGYPFPRVTCSVHDNEQPYGQRYCDGERVCEHPSGRNERPLIRQGFVYDVRKQAPDEHGEQEAARRYSPFPNEYISDHRNPGDEEMSGRSHSDVICRNSI